MAVIIPNFSIEHRVSPWISGPAAALAAYQQARRAAQAQEGQAQYQYDAQRAQAMGEAIGQGVGTLGMGAMAAAGGYGEEMLPLFIASQMGIGPLYGQAQGQQAMAQRYAEGQAGANLRAGLSGYRKEFGGQPDSWVKIGPSDYIPQPKWADARAYGRSELFNIHGREPTKREVIDWTRGQNALAPLPGDASLEGLGLIAPDYSPSRPSVQEYLRRYGVSLPGGAVPRVAPRVALQADLPRPTTQPARPGRPSPQQYPDDVGLDDFTEPVLGQIEQAIEPFTEKRIPQQNIARLQAISGAAQKLKADPVYSTPQGQPLRQRMMRRLATEAAGLMQPIPMPRKQPPQTVDSEMQAGRGKRIGDNFISFDRSGALKVSKLEREAAPNAGQVQTTPSGVEYLIEPDGKITTIPSTYQIPQMFAKMFQDATKQEGGPSPSPALAERMGRNVAIAEKSYEDALEDLQALDDVETALQAIGTQLKQLLDTEQPIPVELRAKYATLRQEYDRLRTATQR